MHTITHLFWGSTLRAVLTALLSPSVFMLVGLAVMQWVPRAAAGAILMLLSPVFVIVFLGSLAAASS